MFLVLLSLHSVLLMLFIGLGPLSLEISNLSAIIIWDTELSSLRFQHLLRQFHHLAPQAGQQMIYLGHIAEEKTHL